MGSYLVKGKNQFEGFSTLTRVLDVRIPIIIFVISNSLSLSLLLSPLTLFNLPCESNNSFSSSSMIFLLVSFALTSNRVEMDSTSSSNSSSSSSGPPGIYGVSILVSTLVTHRHGRKSNVLRVCACVGVRSYAY